MREYIVLCSDDSEHHVRGDRFFIGDFTLTIYDDADDCIAAFKLWTSIVPADAVDPSPVNEKEIET